MAVSSTTFGLYYELSDKNTHHNTSSLMTFDLDNVATTVSPAAANLSWLSITSMVVYITSFSLGWGPIPWLLMSEIFPSKARGVASSIATALNWTLAFAITKLFLVLKVGLSIMIGYNEIYYWMNMREQRTHTNQLRTQFTTTLLSKRNAFNSCSFNNKSDYNYVLLIATLTFDSAK